MSELLDNPKGKGKYNEHLYEALEKVELKIEWKCVKAGDGEDEDICRAQINSNILRKIIDGFEKLPVQQDEGEEEQAEKYLYDFSYCDFLDEVDFRSATFTGNADFRFVTFAGDAYFSCVTFTGEATFRSATFTGEASFGYATFTGKASFMDATFTGYATFWFATFTGYATFRFATFTGNADFRSATFTGEVYFWYAIFKEKAYFRSATFTGDADFSSATFEEGATFSSATFTGEADFSSAVFKEEANFISATFVQASNFEGTVFKLANFEKTVFKEQTYFLQASIDELNLKGVHIKENAHFLESNIILTDRETARIIKHEYYKLNNNLEAMHWNKREMEEYSKELKEKAVTNKEDTYTHDMRDICTILDSKKINQDASMLKKLMEKGTLKEISDREVLERIIDNNTYKELREKLKSEQKLADALVPKVLNGLQDIHTWESFQSKRNQKTYIRDEVLKKLTAHQEISEQLLAWKVNIYKEILEKNISDYKKTKFQDKLSGFVLGFQNHTTRHGTNWALGMWRLLSWNFLFLTFMLVVLLAQRVYIGLPVLPQQTPANYIADIFYALQLLFNFINPLHNTSELIDKFHEIFSIGINAEHAEWYKRLFHGLFGTFDVLFRALNVSLLYLTVSAFRRLSRTK